jgi:hypothetical protein
MNTDPLIEMRADGHLAVLNFEVAETSKLTRKFIAELATVLTAAARKPLVFSNDRQLVAVYKAAVSHAQLTDESGRAFRCSLTFADSRSRKTIAFTTDAEVFPDGGQWGDKRTPETVYRHELPCFDAQATCHALTDIVSRWETSGDLQDPQPTEEIRAAYLARQPKMPSEDEVAAGYAQRGPVSDLDVQDPVRFLPGMLQKIRDYRKAHGLDAGQIKDQRVNRARP